MLFYIIRSNWWLLINILLSQVAHIIHIWGNLAWLMHGVGDYRVRLCERRRWRHLPFYLCIILVDIVLYLHEIGRLQGHERLGIHQLYLLQEVFPHELIPVLLEYFPWHLLPYSYMISDIC